MYEVIKRDLEGLVIFEDSVLYIHVCNQLGNCYHKLGDADKALDHLQLSLQSIQKVRGSANSDEPSVIDDMMTAKICRNIAVIAEMKGYLNDSIKMNEQCLMLKIRSLGIHHVEVLISQLQCAMAFERVGDL